MNLNIFPLDKLSKLVCISFLVYSNMMWQVLDIDFTFPTSTYTSSRYTIHNCIRTDSLRMTGQPLNNKSCNPSLAGLMHLYGLNWFSSKTHHVRFLPFVKRTRCREHHRTGRQRKVQRSASHTIQYYEKRIFGCGAGAGDDGISGRFSPMNPIWDSRIDLVRFFPPAGALRSFQGHISGIYGRDDRWRTNRPAHHRTVWWGFAENRWKFPSHMHPWHQRENICGHEIPSCHRQINHSRFADECISGPKEFNSFFFSCRNSWWHCAWWWSRLSQYLWKILWRRKSGTESYGTGFLGHGEPWTRYERMSILHHNNGGTMA